MTTEAGYLAEPDQKAARTDRAPLLEVDDLRVSFATEGGIVRAVDGVSFTVQPGEVLGVVGESGCGKSVTSLAIMGLLPRPAGQIDSGTIKFKGTDLVTASADDVRRIRGDRIAMVFQDPLTALNPVHRIGAQIAEVIRAHRDIDKAAARHRAVELLDLVGIPNPRQRARDYPHQFSGGMRQRAMIAMAIALDPDLLIADEPTTALDVTVQAQILELLLEVRRQFDSAVVLITHDLGVVAETADRVMVMYAGRKAEEGTVDQVFESPHHPYTWGLLGSTTRVDEPRQDRLYQIPGAPPSLMNPPTGCRFAPRCAFAQQLCRDKDPSLRTVQYGHTAACHFAGAEGWRMGVEPADVAARLAGGDWP